MTRYTHILLDNDGVLVDTEPLYFRATQASVAELGIELSHAIYMSLMVDGRNAWELARQRGVKEVDIAEARRRRNLRYRELLASEPIDIEGVHDVITQLAQDYHLAIVTTALREDFELIHRHRSLVNKVDFVVTRESYEHSKPHPEPYLKAIERFGIGPETALAIEDSQRGVTAAIAAGIDCVAVSSSFTASHDVSHATYQINRLADVMPCILNRT